MSRQNGFLVHQAMDNTPSNPVQAFATGLQQGQQAQANAFNLQRAPIEAQQRDDAVARQRQMQDMGMIASAAYGVTDQGSLDAAKESLRGIVPDDDLAGVTLETLPGLINQMRGLEGQISDERDLRDWQTGQQRFAATFAQRQQNADRSYGVQVEKANAPSDEYGRYVAEEQDAGRPPLSRIDYAQAKKGKGTTVYDANGNVIFQQGGGADGTPPKMTVDAAKNSGFYLRTQEANSILNNLEVEGTDFWQQMSGNLPMGVGNFLRSPDFQKYDQARRDFVNAILRRESGAVISDSEFDNADKQYFPQPGDSPEVIAQKRQNRQNAIEGLKIGSGEGGSYVDDTRDNATTSDPQSLTNMSDEDLDDLIRALQEN